MSNFGIKIGLFVQEIVAGNCWRIKAQYEIKFNSKILPFRRYNTVQEKIKHSWQKKHKRYPEKRWICAKMTNLYTVELLLNVNCCSFNSQLFTSQFSAKQNFRVGRCTFSFIYGFMYRQLTWLILREKCSNMKFFLVCIFPYSVRTRRNAD